MDDNVHELFPRSDETSANVLEKHLQTLKKIIDGEVTETVDEVFEFPLMDLKAHCIHVPQPYDDYLSGIHGVMDRRLEALAIFVLATTPLTYTQLRMAATTLMLAPHHAVKEPEHKLANAGLVVYFYRTVNNTVCMLRVATVKSGA